MSQSSGMILNDNFGVNMRRSRINTRFMSRKNSKRIDVLYDQIEEVENELSSEKYKSSFYKSYFELTVKGYECVLVDTLESDCLLKRKKLEDLGFSYIDGIHSSKKGTIEYGLRLYAKEKKGELIEN